MAHRRGLGEGPQHDAARIAVGAAPGQLRQQRNAGAGGDHLPQRLEAGRAKVLRVAHADVAADLERLVAQAVAFLEQQQCFALKIRHPNAVALREPVLLRECNA